MILNTCATALYANRKYTNLCNRSARIANIQTSAYQADTRAQGARIYTNYTIYTRNTGTMSTQKEQWGRKLGEYFKSCGFNTLAQVYIAYGLTIEPQPLIDNLESASSMVDANVNAVIDVLRVTLKSADEFVQIIAKERNGHRDEAARQEAIVTDLEAKIVVLRRNLQGQQRANNLLTDQVNILTETNPFKDSPAPATPLPSRRISRDPEPFSGAEKNAIKRQEQYTSWKMQIKTNFLMDHTFFNTELAQILHISSLLAGDAHTTNKGAVQNCFESPYDARNWEYKTGDAFLAALDKQYEVVNIKQVAQREFDKLEMGKNQGFPNFLAQFKTMSAQAGKTNEQRVDALKKKVTDEIASRYISLPNRPGDDDFDAWAEATTKIWEAIQEYEHNKGHAKKWEKQDHKAKSSQQLHSSDPDAMDLDQLKISKLTESDRQWCIDNSACFFCRKPGHSATDCKVKKKAADDWDKGIRGGQGGVRGSSFGRGRGGPSNRGSTMYGQQGGRGNDNPYGQQMAGQRNLYQSYPNNNPYRNYVIGSGTESPPYVPPSLYTEYPSYPPQQHQPNQFHGYIEQRSNPGSPKTSDSVSNTGEPLGN